MEIQQKEKQNCTTNALAYRFHANSIHDQLYWLILCFCISRYIHTGKVCLYKNDHTDYTLSLSTLNSLNVDTEMQNPFFS